MGDFFARVSEVVSLNNASGKNHEGELNLGGRSGDTIGNESSLSPRTLGAGNAATNIQEEHNPPRLPRKRRG